MLRAACTPQVALDETAGVTSGSGSTPEPWERREEKEGSEAGKDEEVEVEKGAAKGAAGRDVLSSTTAQSSSEAEGASAKEATGAARGVREGGG